MSKELGQCAEHDCEEHDLDETLWAEPVEIFRNDIMEAYDKAAEKVTGLGFLCARDAFAEGNDEILTLTLVIQLTRKVN